jgi:hypothetical protein
MYLLQEPSSRTAYEIAEAIKDHKNNVIRNLHVLVSERLALPSRDETTGIIRFRINQDLMQRLSELLKPAQSRDHSRLRSAQAEFARPDHPPGSSACW